MNDRWEEWYHPVHFSHIQIYLLLLMSWQEIDIKKKQWKYANIITVSSVPFICIVIDIIKAIR